MQDHCNTLKTLNFLCDQDFPQVEKTKSDFIFWRNKSWSSSNAFEWESEFLETVREFSCS